MLRILIADDHDIVREGLKQLLLEEFQPLHIGEARDTYSLIELAFSGSWDIIISDVKMPGEGGFFALEKIKSKTPETPVIIISSNAGDHYTAKALKAGAEKFINKASLSEELVKTVQQVLEKRK